MSDEQPARGVEMLRLFVAVELPEPVRRSLEDAMSMLQREATQGLHWVRPDGVHLTLQFLGATAAERVPSVSEALAAAVHAVPLFELAPGGLGSFGGRSRMRVIWIAVGGDQKTLADLAARVREALAPLGFTADRDEFRAHLTLARVREDTSREERERLYDLIGQVAAPVMPKFAVDRISLMQSILGPGGAQYRCVATFPLAD